MILHGSIHYHVIFTFILILFLEPMGTRLMEALNGNGTWTNRTLRLYTTE